MKVIRNNILFPGAVVIDVGANIGRFTGLASELVKRNGQVHSFEPVHMAYRVLKASVRLKRLRNVSLNPVALSDKNGKAEISVPLVDGWKPKLPVAHMGADPRITLKQEIITKKLDDYCRESNISRVDFIKCDTEGHEYFVLMGGLECLLKNKPTVLCEIYGKYCRRQNVNPSQIFELFYNIGYQSFISTKEGMLLQVKGYKKPSDYLFIHPSKMAISDLKHAVVNAGG